MDHRFMRRGHASRRRRQPQGIRVARPCDDDVAPRPSIQIRWLGHFRRPESARGARDAQSRHQPRAAAEAARDHPHGAGRDLHGRDAGRRRLWRPEEALEDVLNGYVSIETAERDYGVAINPDTMALDKERTAALRER